MARTLIVDAGFDGGNIIVHHVNGPDDIMLGINRDAHSEFYQWFHFRLSGARGVPCRIRASAHGTERGRRHGCCSTSVRAEGRHRPTSALLLHELGRQSAHARDRREQHPERADRGPYDADPHGRQDADR